MGGRSTPRLWPRGWKPFFALREQVTAQEPAVSHQASSPFGWSVLAGMGCCPANRARVAFPANCDSRDQRTHSAEARLRFAVMLKPLDNRAGEAEAAFVGVASRPRSSRYWCQRVVPSRAPGSPAAMRKSWGALVPWCRWCRAPGGARSYRDERSHQRRRQLAARHPTDPRCRARQRPRSLRRQERALAATPKPRLLLQLRPSGGD